MTLKLEEMNFKETNQLYESWLRKQFFVIETDLSLKHERMKESPFPFLRATFYRWCGLWQKNMASFAKAPLILGVGDLHIENYGTWRDLEGRLIWGINDFDEACEMPYAIDLVRLGCSAQIASSCDHLNLSLKKIMDAILDGYVTCLKNGGRAFVLEEEHAFLREIATQSFRDPRHFFEKLNPRFPSLLKPSSEIKKILVSHLPAGSVNLEFAHRSAGLGSLGRPRFIVLAELNGGRIVRETKGLCAPAFLWSSGRSGAVCYQKIIDQSVRMSDPVLRLEKKWVTRRLAPHCTKIEIAALPRKLDELKLMNAMGFELGNIHMKYRRVILADLKKRRKSDWTDAVKLMSELTMNDWHQWLK